MSALPYINRLKLDAVPNRDELNAQSYQDVNRVEGQPGRAGEASPAAVGDGPFELTPELAQVRLLMNIGVVIDRGSPSSTTIQWTQIVSSLANKSLRKNLQKLSPSQTLPASVRIVAASVGDSEAYRNMCHVRVFDHGKEKTMNTPQIYRGSQTKCEEVGYPLHLLTEGEGGLVLEEPPQLTDTFKHYWYVSKSMLTCCAYRQESQHGTYISIPKNSEAARLMYYVLVVKNGAMAAAPENNVTQLDNPGFIQAFKDKHDHNSWRFPEATFKEVSRLLADKLEDVRSKSFNCESLTIEVSCFDIFRDIMVAKGKVPALLTLEVELHLPEMKDALEQPEKATRKPARADLDSFDE